MMPALESLPSKIGPYRVVEKIGEGGMGVVYLARDAESRQVAVKVLGAAVAGDPNGRARLAREVDTMRRVRSPYIAEIIDADVTGNSPYIVTRYVPGQTLEDTVRARGPLRGDPLARLAHGLAAALAAIHAAGVVHRDLKPGNVMLDDGDPVVIDFGIAHVADSTRLTQTGLVMGTPGYLAPEVIEGEPSSGASDVHSWAATVAFAATGRQPFGSGTFQTIFFRVLQGQATLDGIPAALLPLVTASLTPSPRNRPTAAWLASQCAGLNLNGVVPPTTTPGPGGTLVGAPDGFEAPERYLPGAGAPAGYDGAGYGAAGVGGAVNGGPAAYGVGATFPPRNGGPQPNGGAQDYGGAQAYAAAPARGAPAYKPPPLPAPAEAAGDVADLLPPVAYGPPPVSPISGWDTRGLSPAAPGYPGAPAHPGAPGQPRGPRQPTRPVAGLGLLSLAFGVAAVALAIVAPVAGTLVALAAITLLRAADRAESALAARRSAYGARASDVVVVIVSAPWTVAKALLTTVLLLPLAAVVAALAAGASVMFGHTTSLPYAGSWAAGAAIAWSAVGPGSARPRRQLRRMTSGVVRSRGAILVALIACWSLAAAAVSSALAQPPLLWPGTTWMLPHLPSLGNSLHGVQQWLLRHAVSVLHLP
jgi:predicted Ser/Thr protein kinase